MVYSRVKDLPETVQSALRSVGYGREEIKLDPSESYSPARGGGNGYRCFACKVDLVTGAREVDVGSWGGPNMFNPGNAVDMDRNDYPLPPWRGSDRWLAREEGKPVYARLVVHPSAMAPLLPVIAPITERQAYIVTVYGHLNSKGRKDEFSRPYRANPGVTGEPSVDELAELVRLGMLAKAGSGLKVTAEGRNATDGKQPYHYHGKRPE